MNSQNNLGAVSTCPKGDEKYVYFNLTPRPRKKGRYVQYEYREPTTGTLFSTLAPTLEQCRAKRDAWLKVLFN